MRNKLKSDFEKVYKEREDLIIKLNSKEFQDSIEFYELSYENRLRKRFEEEMIIINEINKLNKNLIDIINEYSNNSIGYNVFIRSNYLEQNRDIGLQELSSLVNKIHNKFNN